MIRRYLTLFLLILFASPCFATIPYEQLQTKAKRFFEYEEWSSSQAMYELMLAQKNDINSFNHSIILAGLLKEPTLQLSLMIRTENLAIPLDSVFNGVKDIAIHLNKPYLYVDFLNLVKEKQPWLTRNIYTHLLDFYVFRGNAVGMIDLSEKLLSITPDNLYYLGLLARAYLMVSDFDNFVKTNERIIALDSQNKEAILGLGNYYNYITRHELLNDGYDLSNLTAHNAKDFFRTSKPISADMLKNARLALTFLSQAYDIEETPFLAKNIADLNLIIQNAN